MPDADTLAFDAFWAWLQKHPNCILRAGAGDVVVFDHDEHHWSFGVDPDGGVLYVQCLRGKQTIAEVSLHIEDVAYVQSHLADEDEWFFDLCDQNQQVLYYFVLSHGFEDAVGTSVSHLN
ncbi:MAG: hypothetical protein H6729_09165 [Deltaproteobacteria bacterium]|nr:hypothetical protein [Deltaproteobacteria bacterium]